jgi:hypothetical protein
MFGNRMFRKVSKPTKRKWEILVIYAGHLVFLWQCYDGLNFWLRERQGTHTELWWKNVLVNGHLENKEDNVRTLLRWILGDSLWEWNSSEQYTVEGIRTNTVEPLGSAITVLVSLTLLHLGCLFNEHFLGLGVKSGQEFRFSFQPTRAAVLEQEQFWNPKVKSNFDVEYFLLFQLDFIYFGLNVGQACQLNNYGFYLNV